MADRNNCADLYLLKDSVCQVECIVVDDGEDAEEDILFINLGYTSASTQTDSQFCNDYQPNIPGVPIFYCGQPSPGTVSTQCFIPHRADVCIGTDPPGTCSFLYQGTRPPDRSSSYSSAALPASHHSDVTARTEIMLVEKEGEDKLMCTFQEDCLDFASYFIFFHIIHEHIRA